MNLTTTTDAPAAENDAPAKTADPPRPTAAGPAPLRPSELVVLVAQLAPFLGLDPARIDVRAGPSSRARPGAITLARAERGVAVHELAHVVQHANRGRGDVTRAEAEAGGLAAAARAGRALWVPRAALPSGHVAREEGASGVAPDADALRAQLEPLVEANHEAERQQIIGKLNEVFSTTAEMVEACLHILDTLPFVSARALVKSLPTNTRVHLAQLGDDDHKRHPRSAAAVVTALDEDDFRRLFAAATVGPGTGLHGLTASLLGPDELRAVLAALQRVPEAVMLELMRGDRREDFRTLVATTPPPGTEADALSAALTAERRVTEAHNADLYGRVTAALDGGGAASAQQALEVLEPLTELVTTEVGNATASNAPPTAGERLRWVVGLLDRYQLIEDRLLDRLPEDERYTGRWAPILRLVLAARNPALNLTKAESLLSYGVFDWAITDADARYAYLLVRSTPLAIQDEWRRRDDGKWFTRLIENVPEGEYTGVGSEFVTGVEKEAPDGLVSEELDAVLKQWRPQRNAPNARVILRRLIAHDGNGRPLDTADQTRPVRFSVVRRMDATGEHELREVVNELPDEFVLEENGRQELLDLSTMRDPVQVELQAAALLETGVTDWWVNSREAWVAYQLLRALPVPDQQRFSAANPGRWKAMQNALTEDMKQSLAATVTTGRGPWPGRDALRARLSDERLWTKEHAAELRALINLAYVSDDRRWVFELSKTLRADLRDGLYDIVHDLRLYNQGVGPEEFVGEGLDTRGFWPELGRFVDDKLFVRWILVGVGAWLFMDWIRIGGYSVEVREFDLNWAQWAMGGDLGGAKLEPDPKDPPSERIKVAGAPPPTKANRLSMQADLGTGAVRIQLPELRLASTNFMRGGASYRSGPIHINNLKVVASFSDRHYREPVGAEIDADEIDVRDLVLASTDLPLSSAWSLAHTAVQPFHVKTGATGDEDLKSHQPRGGTLPVPVFGPILQALANVVAIKGGIPFSPTLVDLLLLPVPDLPFGTGTVANALVPSPSPADYLWGLATDGVFRPPRAVQARVADAAAMLRAFEVSFDKLTIEGLSIGANTQIASITLVDVDVGVALSRPAYLRTLLRSLRHARAGMTGKQLEETDKRIAAAEVELKTLTDKERRMETLERKDRWEPGSLTADERRELTALNDELRADTGVVADIGRIEVGPLSGRVQSGGAVLEGIHVEAHAPLGKGQYLPDEELLARLRGGGPIPTEASALLKRTDARISIASTRLLGELSVAAETLPTADELRARLNAMSARVPPDLRQRVADALAVVDAADAAAGELELAREGIAALEAQPPDAARQKRIAELRRRITELPQEILVLQDRAKRLLGTRVGSATFGEISGVFDPETGRLTARIHDVDVRDVSGPGFAIDRISGEAELGVGGLTAIKGDVRTLDAAQLRRGLTGSFGLDATVEGIRTEYGTVGSIAIEGLKGDVLEGGRRLQNVEATRIVVSGVDVGVPGAGVTARSVTIEGLGLDATITDAGAVVDRLDIRRLSADQIVYDGREPDDSTVHAELRSGALTGIHVSGLELGAGGLIKGSVDVAGVQDVRYRVALGTLTGGEHTSVEGTLKGASKKGPVIHAETASAGGKTYSLTLTDLEALGTEVHTPDGSVVIKHVKIGGTIAHSDAGTTVSLHLSAIDLRALNWTAGKLNITSGGAITLDKVDVDATLDAAGLKIRELTVTKLTADQLHVVDKPLDITLGPAGTGGLTVARIHLTDFTLPRGPDGRLAGSPTAGHLEVTGLGVDFAGQVTASLKASGQISAKTITVDFQRGGRLVARAQGLGATVAVDTGGTQATVAFADVDTGLIGVGPDGYTVHDLQVKEITLSGIHLETVAGGHKLKLDSNATGDVTIKSLAVKAHIDPALTKIELTHFKIARIEFQGLVLELPDDHVKVTVLKSEPRAFFRDIVLEGATTGEPFLITPGGPELLRGVARLEETSIPKLEAEVKGAFHGTVGLHTDTASIEFLEKGETKIDVKNPRAKLSDPATLGSERETIKIEELGAESVHVEKGVTTIHHTTLKNLTYTRPGIEVTLQQASIPNDIKTTFTEGTIPELQISEAKFTVDFTKLPEKKPSDPTLYLGGLEKLMDGLQGQLWMTVYAQARILGADDDLEIPVHLQFKDGKINFGGLAAELQGKIRVHYARSGIDDDIIEWAVADPVFELDDSTLVFGVTNLGYRRDLVSWNLLRGEYKIAAGEKRVRLARLIDPVDTGEPSALDKDTLEFRDIVANLSVTTKKPAELTLGYGHIGGRIVFAPSALAGLTIRGDVGAASRPSGRARPASPGKLDVISFDSVKIQTVRLWLPGRDVRVGKRKPGGPPGLEIKDMRDGSLTFKGHDPQLFKATITSAIARDIYWGPSSLRRPR